MERVIRDGQVAVLYSPEYGVGWYSCHQIEELLFDPSIVAWLEAEETDKILSYVTLKYPDAYVGGLKDLSILWLPEGTVFRVDEYDGNESIYLKEQERWITA
jgi:hypothetical protein